jgi:membrane protein
MEIFEVNDSGTVKRLSVDEPPRGTPLIRPRHQRFVTRSLANLIRNPATTWMSLVGVLVWLLPRLRVKRQKVYQIPEPRTPHPSVAKGSRKLAVPEKKGLTIVSMGMELFLAVGMSLLKGHLKTWKSEINAARKYSNPVRIYSDGLPRASDPMLEVEPNQTKPQKSHPKQGGRKIDVWLLLKTTATQWINDKCPQTGAALAYFTVFSLAPLVLVLLAVFGLFFGSEHARDKIIEQLQYMVDPSGIKVIKDIAASAAKPQSGVLATVIGLVVGLFGASGVFGQLQDALNTIWGVKAKPGAGLWGFLRARFLSFAMVAGVCFLLLVSLTVESVLRGLSTYLQNLLPGGHILALLLFLVLDIGVVIVLFAMIFRYLPDVKIAWRDVWVGASLTALLFVIGKFILGLYLGSGAAGSAYGAASSLITLLLWVYYSAQILLFGAEFTQVYANTYGSQVVPEEHAIRVKKVEIELPQPGAHRHPQSA